MRHDVHPSGGSQSGAPFFSGQVALVQHEEGGVAGKDAVHPRELLGERRAAGVQQVQAEVGAGDPVPGAGDPFALDGARRLAQAGRVRDAERHALQRQRFFDHVAGGARLVAHDRAGNAEKRVEKARFPDVGRAADHDKRPFAEETPLAGGGDLAGERIAQKPDPPGNRAERRGVHLPLLQVEPGLQVGAQVRRILVEGVEPAPEDAVELGPRGPRGPDGAGRDEIGDRLGLGQVHLAVEEGAAREFAGAGRTRPGGQDGVQETPGRRAPAMPLKLHDLLPRVTARGLEDEHDALVEDLPRPRVDKAGKTEGARLRRRAASERDGHAPRDGKRLGAGDPHDGDPGFAGSRRDRGNGGKTHGKGGGRLQG